MEFAILSDTHISDDRTLATDIRRRLSRADGILHAGDLTSAAFLAELRSLAPVVAARGNCDCWDIGLIDLPVAIITNCAGLRVGLTHGASGAASAPPLRAIAAFAGQETDLIIFGHTHVPFDAVVDGVRLFNPGSPTQKRRQPRCSYGWLTVTESGYRLEHIFL
ncbi:MAG: metallophosphatase family protein [Gracilibacteraceae bacterium]|jgi:putative phosphoesterase|nr:metallophosphatase family protein [Gracilibacteraceae bacterium]